MVYEEFTILSRIASATGPAPNRSCQPSGVHCEQKIVDLLLVRDSISSRRSFLSVGEAATRRNSSNIRRSYFCSCFRYWRNCPCIFFASNSENNSGSRMYFVLILAWQALIPKAQESHVFPHPEAPIRIMLRWLRMYSLVPSSSISPDPVSFPVYSSHLPDWPYCHRALLSVSVFRSYC